MIISEQKAEITKRYRKTPKGVLTNMYDHMRRRHQISFSLSEFHSMFLGDKKFNRLFVEWAKSGYIKSKKPSIDRINKKKGYSVDNVHMVTWGENRFKQTMERRVRKYPVLQIKDGVVVKKYRSQREAVRETGIPQGNMSAVLSGRRNHAGGFKFEYQNPDLLTTEAGG